MAVLSEREAEIQKWNRPYVYQEYPRVLYKVRLVNGQPVADVTITVNSDAELDRREREGFVKGNPDTALAAYEAQQQAIAEAAAQAQHQANRLSATARAEYDAVDEASDEHLTGQLVGKRGPGRPRKEV